MPKDPTKDPQFDTHAMGTETFEALDPGTVAQVMDLASEPLLNLKAAAEECGLSPSVAQRLVARVRSQYQPMMSEMKAFKTSDITKKIEDKAMRALDWLDDYKMAQASAKDLAIIVGILLEKRQLMRGEPTHIFSTTERMSLNELVPMMVKEANRRGMELSHEGEMVDVTPGAYERNYRSRSGGSMKNVQKALAVKRKVESGEPS